MALEEITFTNTDGEEINLSNLVNQMINYYKLKREVGETKLTDFNEGSEIRNLLEAFAICIYALLEEQSKATSITFISTSEGTWLDKIGEMPFINLPRITGDSAEGVVRFTLESEQAEEFIIPEDTIVACSDTEIDFVTTQDCIISAGETSNTTTVECLTEGEDGNVPAGSIDSIIDNTINLDLVTVTNPESLDGGADEEYDDDYRERLLNNIRADGFGTQGWYENLCESIEDVHDVLLIDNANYTKKVLVNGYSKPTLDVTLLDTLTKLSDVTNKVLNHTFTVDKPVYTTVNLAITMNVTTEIDTDYLNDALTTFFNGGESIVEATFEGLNINQTVSKQDIISILSIFENLVEVTSVKQNGTEITTLTPATNGVLKLGTVTYTQNEV